MLFFPPTFFLTQSSLLLTAFFLFSSHPSSLKEFRYLHFLSKFSHPLLNSLQSEFTLQSTEITPTKVINNVIVQIVGHFSVCLTWLLYSIWYCFLQKPFVFRGFCDTTLLVFFLTCHCSFSMSLAGFSLPACSLNFSYLLLLIIFYGHPHPHW